MRLAFGAFLKVVLTSATPCSGGIDVHTTSRVADGTGAHAQNHKASYLLAHLHRPLNAELHAILGNSFADS
jgi:hypothetical protein